MRPPCRLAGWAGGVALPTAALTGAAAPGAVPVGLPPLLLIGAAAPTCRWYSRTTEVDFGGGGSGPGRWRELGSKAAGRGTPLEPGR